MKIVLLGCVAGILSAFFGVGGGVLMVPALGYLFGMSQHEAQGTSLAVLLLPVGLPGVIQYYKAGHVNTEVALYLIAGFLVGITATAHWVSAVPDRELRQLFGVFLLLVSLRMILAS